MTDAERLWKTCSDTLREQVSESTWKTYFSGVHPLDFTGDRLILAVPNLLVRERLEGRYLAMVEDTLANVAGGTTSHRDVASLGDLRRAVRARRRESPYPDPPRDD